MGAETHRHYHNQPEFIIKCEPSTRKQQAIYWIRETARKGLEATAGFFHWIADKTEDLADSIY